MKTTFRTSFVRDLKNISDRNLLRRIRRAVEVVERVTELSRAGNVKKISGTTKFKMTDFKVEPPTLTVLGLGIKTGDEVKLSFEWMVAPKTAGPAAAASQ